jgi:hypothetical protein
LVALAGADRQRARREVDVLDAQAEGLEQAQARAVEQRRDESRRSAEVAEHRGDLRARQHRGHTVRTLRADEVVEPGEVTAEHCSMKKEERRQRASVDLGPRLVPQVRAGSLLPSRAVIAGPRDGFTSRTSTGARAAIPGSDLRLLRAALEALDVG